ncbi:lipid A export ATP-binding/permease protein MsbA [Pasteurella canis]|nr:lipid A export ATP-binding/permease protein MsbA [Pasteurella canis]
MDQNLTAGSFTVVFSSMLAMMRPLKSLTNVNAQFQKGMAACQTLFALLDLETEKDLGTHKGKMSKAILHLKMLRLLIKDVKSPHYVIYL